MEYPSVDYKITNYMRIVTKNPRILRAPLRVRAGELARDPDPYVREVAEWNLRGLVPMDLRADIFRGLPFNPADAAAGNAGHDST